MSDLYLECTSGISGDMAVAALLDLGADKLALQKALDSISAQGFKTEISRVNKNGIDCCDFNVILDSEHENHDHDMQYLFGQDEESYHSEQEPRHSEATQPVILSGSEESVDDKARHSERSEESVNEEISHSEAKPKNLSMTRCFAHAQHDGKVHAQHDKRVILSETTRHFESESRHSEATQHVILSESEESVDDKARHSERSEESVSFTEKQDSTNAKAFVYILTNFNKSTLYVGVTNDLKRRVYEHKNHLFEGFTDKYNCESLVYFECFEDIKTAIEREKYLKGKKRDFKESLINSINPNWQDLYDYLFKDVSASPQHDDKAHAQHDGKVHAQHDEHVILSESEESFNEEISYSEAKPKNLSMTRCFANAEHDGKAHTQHDEHVILSETTRHSERSEESHHHHEHEHHHHEHRNLNDVLEIINKTQMSSEERKLACKIFEIIAQAESKAHNLSVDKVHFHEVGALDSIVDVIALAVCFDSLKINRVFVPFMNEGTGTVRCQHGILPIPVPATANIIQKYELPLHIMAEKGEFITPTGAAFVAAVITDKVLPSSFTIKKIGLGAGKRCYERPSILRAFLIEEDVSHTLNMTCHSERSEESINNMTCHSEAEPKNLSMTRCFANAQHDGKIHAQHDDFSNASGATTSTSETVTSASETDGQQDDTIIKLETNIDDCTSETLGFVMDKLFAQGALEVNFIPCFMKKNRPSYLLTVICTENSRSKLEEIIFKNTTTIGIRRSFMQRTILNRKELELSSPYGKIRAKEVWGFGVKRILPEYDDVARIAQETEKSFLEIYSELATLCKSRKQP